MLKDMLNGTKCVGVFSRVHSPDGRPQWVFPENPVRYVYRACRSLRTFHSKYVRLRKGLKVSVRLETSELEFFCRSIPISLWVGSLLAVAWGGMLCQLGND